MKKKTILIGILLLIIILAYPAVCFVSGILRPAPIDFKTLCQDYGRKNNVEFGIDADAMKRDFAALSQKLTAAEAACHTGIYGKNNPEVEDRLMLAKRLVKNLPSYLASKKLDDLYTAGRMLDDLRLFITYFEKKQTLIKEEAAAGEAVTLSAANFGVKADGKSDDSAALAAALEAAKKYAPRRVIVTLPAGTIYLTSRVVRENSPHWKAHLILKDLKNVTVTGAKEGTTLLMNDWNAMEVTIYHCVNTTLQNLTIRLKVPPFHQGDIKEVYPGEKALLFQCDAGFPEMDVPGGTEACCQSYNAKTGRLVFNATHFFYTGKYEKKGPGLYKVYFRDFKAGLKPGLKLVFPIREGMYMGCYLAGCSFCTCDRITIYNSRSTSFTDVESFADAFTNCRVVPAKGAYLASDADGIHCQNDDFGVYVANCEFRNLGDDCFNTYSKGQLIDAFIKDGIVTSNGGEFYPEGTRFSVVSSQTGKVLAVRTSKGLKSGKIGNTSWAMTAIDRPLPKGIISKEKIKNVSDREMKEARAGFGSVSLPNVTFAHGKSGVGTVIRDSVFAGTRNCGIVCQTSSALITGNRIENVNAAAIIVTSLIYAWQEGYYPFNVVVTKNTIQDAGSGIQTSARVENDNAAKSIKALYDITVSDNTVNATAPGILRNLSSVSSQK